MKFAEFILRDIGYYNLFIFLLIIIISDNIFMQLLSSMIFVYSLRIIIKQVEIE